MSKIIQLTNSNLTAIVDDKDYPFLSQFKWYAKLSEGSRNRWHAARCVDIGGKAVTIRMHRLITEADDDQMVYHINGDRLDNRRSNLQSRTINPWTGRASGFRGVHQVAFGTWRAEISFAGRKHLIGAAYADPVEAAHAYDDAARRLFGTSALTNFPE